MNPLFLYTNPRFEEDMFNAHIFFYLFYFYSGGGFTIPFILGKMHWK